MSNSGPGCLIQVIWFIFLGWWLGAIAIAVAWVLNVSVIGLPIGAVILNNIPKILALQEPERHLKTATKGGETVIVESEAEQPNILLRAVFFVLIGWWWSAVWLALGYLLCATILLLPIGLQTFRLAPTMTTLRRY